MPAAWSEATVRAALATVNNAITAAAISAAAEELTQEVLRIMLLQKVKLVSVALLGAFVCVWGASATLGLRAEEPKTAGSDLAVVANQLTDLPKPQPPVGAFDDVGTMNIRGRVLDPAGKPVVDAAIYVRHDIDIELPSSVNASPREVGRVATSDADGRFRFTFDKAASDNPYSHGPAWKHAQIVAVASGFGPAWLNAGSVDEGSEATFHLVADDVPIRGRILDTQGRPVAEATVRLREIGAAKVGADLAAMLAKGEVDYDIANVWYYGPDWLGRHGTWITDAEGRFEIKGVGRDRIAGLEFESSQMERDTLYVLAGAGLPQSGPRPRSGRRSRPVLRFPAPPLVGPDFDHILGPTKPITGVVRLKGTGKPLAGVRVRALEPRKRARVEAVTDSIGRFRLIGLPKAKSYLIEAIPTSGVDPFLGARVTLTDTVGLEPIETTIDLHKGIVIRGRLLEPGKGRRPYGRGTLHPLAGQPQRRRRQYGPLLRSRRNFRDHGPARCGNHSHQCPRVGKPLSKRPAETSRPGEMAGDRGHVRAVLLALSSVSRRRHSGGLRVVCRRP